MMMPANFTAVNSEVVYGGADLFSILAEHNAQSGVDSILEEGVADQSDHVGVELLDVSSVPDRSGGVSQNGEQVSAAVDDLRVNRVKFAGIIIMNYSLQMNEKQI